MLEAGGATRGVRTCSILTTKAAVKASPAPVVSVTPTCRRTEMKTMAGQQLGCTHIQQAGPASTFGPPRSSVRAFTHVKGRNDACVLRLGRAAEAVRRALRASRHEHAARWCWGGAGQGTQNRWN
jgi:hypothetical protein